MRRVLFSPLSAWLAIGIGILLLAINGYGLTQSLRNPALLEENNVLFINDIQFSLPEMLSHIPRTAQETPQQYAQRMNTVVQKGIAHIKDWQDPETIQKYHLNLPIWENYLLFFLSHLPYFKTELRPYHFSDYKKSIERGIGLCGDHAIILSSLLEREGIATAIVAFHGHVVTEVILGNKAATFDPDYGVVIPYPITTIHATPQIIRPYYLQAGYNENKVAILAKIYASSPKIFANVYEFGPTKMQVEIAAYILIWLIPGITIAIGIMILRHIHNRN